MSLYEMQLGLETTKRYVWLSDESEAYVWLVFLILNSVENVNHFNFLILLLEVAVMAQNA